MGIQTTATATEVARAIRAGEVTAAEVLEGQLARVARHNPALNAIVTLDEEGARRRAQEADRARARGESWGPLHGVPITIKDVFEVAGLRSTASYPPLANHVPTQDATAVRRLREAGAIILGKTNMPALASDFQTDGPLFGRANNPWDLARTPGGSTGGGAAALAAGLSFLELGSDLAGSLRIPAHFCGIFGLAPTAGRVPRAGHLPRQAPGGTLSQFLRVGLLARSIDDLRLGLSVIAGPDVEEPDLPPAGLAEAPARGLRGLRIAWTESAGGVTASAATRAALHDLAGKLAEQGCTVEQREPEGFDFALARQVHGHLFFTALGLGLPAMPRLMGRYLGGVRAFGLDLRAYREAEGQALELVTAMERFLAGWDAWLCPVTVTPAFPHHAPSGHFGPTPIYRQPLAVDGGTVDYGLANSAFTIPLNVTGNPVAVIPVGQTGQGLPVGVQVVGRRWADMELLSIAGQLAQLAGPWRCPPGYEA